MTSKTKWVIKRTDQVYGLGGGTRVSYYIGKTYQLSGELYGEFIDWSRRKEAKPYSSEKRAENAMDKLKQKVGNWDKLEVVPFPEKDQKEVK